MIETITPTQYVQSLCHGTPEAAMRPQYQAPSEQFLEELVSPEIVVTGGLSHAVYTFNQDKLGDVDRPPVVANLTYGIPILSSYGSTLMNALATQLDGPLIGIDYPGCGLSSAVRWSELSGLSVSFVAQARAKVLEKLGHNKVDLMGICIGGVLAMRTAVALGEKARSIQTHATPGFERTLTGRMQLAGMNQGYGERTWEYGVMAEREDKFTQDDFNHLDNLPKAERQPAALFRLGATIGFGGAYLPRLTTELHPSTAWRDVVGDHDSLTSVRRHAQAVEARNQNFPGSSEMTVLQGIDHEWSRERIVLTARDVELFSQRITDQAA